MSKLAIEQKTVKQLLGDNKADFLIPDYQRPYAWEDKECQTLWDDIFNFAFPGGDSSNFDRHNDEYFLGPIVTFQNKKKQQEVIDGQQRLTTLMLLLRAFYTRFEKSKDADIEAAANNIAKCIWKTDEFDRPDQETLKINSEVATDNDKKEFLDIMTTGKALDGLKSQYASNYSFFEKKIDTLSIEYPFFFSLMPTRILNNCILLPIEAESQDTALRIFSTLNDRGKPLSDSDIFKAQLYKFYSEIGKKNDFIEKWKQIEEKCIKIYHPIAGTPMDEAFTRYMYYARALQGIKSSTTEALRKFYERDSYAILRKEGTFDDIIDLTNFWEDVQNQNIDRFSERILRRLYVLNYAPNGMWTYFTSVYYLHNRDDNGSLDDEKFYIFLNKITAFIWANSLTNPGVNALRTPVFAEMVNIVNGENIELKKFTTQQVTNALNNYSFTNNRGITRSMLTWWAFHDDEQVLLSLERSYDIEHIFPKSRQMNEGSLTDPKNLESLGNKALLETRINIRATDYRFNDKKKYYIGFENSKKKKKEGTEIKELLDLAVTKNDFSENDIVQRNAAMILEFIKFLKVNDIIQDEDS